ncbi:MAG: prepilin-type N-terminal cleavage/methylation domain-containing protein [Candidatus Aceula meridiana]|nr:prepilin-type N-terminal cleavage/methylation domain-containing protein [Candidatus Aceula meridiana]
MNLKKGFTLVELMVVLMVISLLAANVAIQAVVRNRQTAEDAACTQARRQIQEAELFYFGDKGVHSIGLSDLVDSGYLLSLPECPNKGVYAWIPYPANSPSYQSILGCSIHTGAEALTSLGSTFTEISQGFIDFINAYYATNGNYPRNGWKNALRDLGLDVDEWADGINGIIYRPKSGTLLIKPDSGYSLTVDRASGSTITVSGNKKLIYSASDDKWYYQRIRPNNEVNMSTFQVINP